MFDDIPETKVGALDMRSVKDQRDALRSQRWAIDEKFREEIINATRFALKFALEKKSAREINGTVRNLIGMVGQNQADEHLAEKHARLDEGKATENVATTFRLEFDERDAGA